MSVVCVQVVLLRNRDRLPLLWPPVFDHLASIIRGKGVSFCAVKLLTDVPSRHGNCLSHTCADAHVQHRQCA